MNLKLVFTLVLGFFTILNMQAQISKAEIIATGLTCSMCSNAINKQLKSLSEVDSVSIDLNTNTFTVFIKKESSMSPKILKERVEKAGFFVGSMIVTMSFDNVDISNSNNFEKDGLALVVVDAKTKMLNGETKVKIMDKGFVTQKEFKKLSKSMNKYPTYLMENEDDFHIKIN